MVRQPVMVRQLMVRKLMVRKLMVRKLMVRKLMVRQCRQQASHPRQVFATQPARCGCTGSVSKSSNHYPTVLREAALAAGGRIEFQREGYFSGRQRPTALTEWACLGGSGAARNRYRAPRLNS